MAVDIQLQINTQHLVILYIYIYSVLLHLYLPGLPSGVHPAGHIDGVAPDVVQRFTSSYYTGHHWTVVQTCTNTRNGIKTRPYNRRPILICKKNRV